MDLLELKAKISPAENSSKPYDVFMKHVQKTVEKPFFACLDAKQLYFSRKIDFSIFSFIFHDFPEYRDLKMLEKYEKIENFKKKFSEIFFRVNSNNFHFWSFPDCQ